MTDRRHCQRTVDSELSGEPWQESIKEGSVVVVDEEKSASIDGLVVDPELHSRRKVSLANDELGNDISWEWPPNVGLVAQELFQLLLVLCD